MMIRVSFTNSRGTEIIKLAFNNVEDLESNLSKTDTENNELVSLLKAVIFIVNDKNLQCAVTHGELVSKENHTNKEQELDKTSNIVISLQKLINKLIKNNNISDTINNKVSDEQQIQVKFIEKENLISELTYNLREFEKELLSNDFKISLYKEIYGIYNKQNKIYNKKDCENIKLNEKDSENIKFEVTIINNESSSPVSNTLGHCLLLKNLISQLINNYTEVFYKIFFEDGSSLESSFIFYEDKVYNDLETKFIEAAAKINGKVKEYKIDKVGIIPDDFSRLKTTNDKTVESLHNEYNKKNIIDTINNLTVIEVSYSQSEFKQIIVTKPKNKLNREQLEDLIFDELIYKTNILESIKISKRPSGFDGVCIFWEYNNSTEITNDINNKINSNQSNQTTESNVDNKTDLLNPELSNNYNVIESQNYDAQNKDSNEFLDNNNLNNNATVNQIFDIENSITEKKQPSRDVLKTIKLKIFIEKNSKTNNNAQIAQIIIPRNKMMQIIKDSNKDVDFLIKRLAGNIIENIKDEKYVVSDVEIIDNSILAIVNNLSQILNSENIKKLINEINAVANNEEIKNPENQDTDQTNEEEKKDTNELLELNYNQKTSKQNEDTTPKNDNNNQNNSSNDMDITQELLTDNNSEQQTVNNKVEGNVDISTIEDIDNLSSSQQVQGNNDSIDKDIINITNEEELSASNIIESTPSEILPFKVVLIFDNINTGNKNHIEFNAPAPVDNSSSQLTITICSDDINQLKDTQINNYTDQIATLIVNAVKKLQIKGREITSIEIKNSINDESIKKIIDNLNSNEIIDNLNSKGVKTNTTARLIVNHQATYSLNTRPAFYQNKIDNNTEINNSNINHSDYDKPSDNTIYEDNGNPQSKYQNNCHNQKYVNNQNKTNQNSSFELSLFLKRNKLLICAAVVAIILGVTAALIGFGVITGGAGYLVFLSATSIPSYIIGITGVTVASSTALGVAYKASFFNKASNEEEDGKGNGFKPANNI